MNKLIILPLLIILNACTPKTIYIDNFIKPKIDLAPRPESVKLSPIYFYVISGAKDEQFTEFKKSFMKKNQNIVFTAMSIRDYENLANNVQELRRYISQQDDVIIYYENMLMSFREDEK